MKNLLFVFILVLLCSFLNSTIINVPEDQPTIQAGIAAATNTDTVLVQPGTYVENINYNGKLITVGSLFLTTADTSYISTTIIDGDSLGSVVLFTSEEDSTAVLTGFTITNGSDTFGGGVNCIHSSSPDLKYLVIIDNYANNGGGINCNGNSNPSISNVIISDNSTFNGGGIYSYQSNPSITNTVITGNSASYGGGISCNDNSNISLINVTISDNIASTAGGGIECWNNSNPSLTNCILWNDSPQEIFLTSSSINATYSDIEGGWGGVGNIDSDPLFVNAVSGDYHLQETSPCIDSGDPASPLDPDGSIADMGALYFQYEGPVWHISTTGSDITGNGSELNPFATIQHGIIFCSDTDTVLVQPGIYYENINYNGKNIVVGSQFLTTQNTAHISSTTIDGSISGSVVTFETGENSTAILCGFTIMNGYANEGGGIYCSSASPTLYDLAITINSAGGMFGYGGGIYCNNSFPSLVNVAIFNNDATYAGGGIYLDSSNPSLVNVTITDNIADIPGPPSGYGGGIYSFNNSSPSLLNSIIWNNSPQGSSIVTVTYSNIEGGCSGTGNIDSDPLFVDPLNRDYQLTKFSPCIDAGDPASSLDPDGTIADMGAYYYDQILFPIPPIADFTLDTTIGYEPLIVNFTDLSTQGSGIIDEWYWDFGDGNNSALQNPFYEYISPGIYTVSLTVTDANDSIDTEIKVDYITVFSSDPPAPPTGVEVEIIHPDAIISWNAVDTTIVGDPISLAGYVITYSEIPDDDYFWFLGFTTNINYTHQDVAQYSTQMFYQVKVIVDLFRDEIEYLNGLNDPHLKIKWKDVKKRLRKGVFLD